MLTAEQHGNVLDAEAKLADIDLLEDLAMLHDTETCPKFRRRLAEQYRRAVGVPPERREELRRALQRLCATGQRKIADAIACYGG